jgi:hypothetical protein
MLPHAPFTYVKTSNIYFFPPSKLWSVIRKRNSRTEETHRYDIPLFVHSIHVFELTYEKSNGRQLLYLNIYNAEIYYFTSYTDVKPFCPTSYRKTVTLPRTRNDRAKWRSCKRCTVSNQQVLGSSLCRDTDYLERGLQSFSSLPAGRCRDGTLIRPQPSPFKPLSSHPPILR